MSKSLGRRDGKWHKEKKIRRLFERRNELLELSMKREYVELEKPQFAGWDVSLTLRSSGKHRSDSPQLQKVVDVLNSRKSFFTKDVKKIQFIRRSGFTLGSLNTYYSFSTFSYNGLNTKFLSSRDYHLIPDEIKKYFSISLRYKFFKEEQYKYQISDSFPWYELRLMIKKSYYAYRVFYDTAAQSEADKIYNLNYVEFSKLWGKRRRDSYLKSIKSAWRSSTKEIVSKQMTEDEILDYKYPKCWDKKLFGWS
jgi:hypothetical protein